jgi:hypothetical protein
MCTYSQIPTEYWVRYLREYLIHIENKIKRRGVTGRVAVFGCLTLYYEVPRPPTTYCACPGSQVMYLPWGR